MLDEHLSTLEVFLIRKITLFNNLTVNNSLPSFSISQSHLTDAAELVKLVLDIFLRRPLSLQVQADWQTDLHGLGGRG